MADHSAHSNHLNPWLLAALGGVGAIISAPYLLPLVGLGSPTTALDAGHFIAGPAALGAGTGLAAGAQTMLGSIPGIGGALTSSALVTIPGLGISIASGALVTIAATAVIGIGGVLLANWLEKREDPNAKIKWSKVIRTAALATSALIALPGLLSGISIGLTFLAGLAAQAIPALATFPSETAMAMKGTLGATTMEMGAVGGIGALLPHLFTCGLAALPVVGAMFIKPSTTIKAPALPTERLAAPAMAQHAHGAA